MALRTDNSVVYFRFGMRFSGKGSGFFTGSFESLHPGSEPKSNITRISPTNIRRSILNVPFRELRAS